MLVCLSRVYHQQNFTLLNRVAKLKQQQHSSFIAWEICAKTISVVAAAGGAAVDGTFSH